jgi:filamentous hemagglutinin
LQNAGYGDVQAAFRGSSVTGVSFKTGAPFDVGRVSDFDLALASSTLLQRAKELGIGLRGGGTRTVPLKDKHLKMLGLLDLQQELNEMAGRPVTFMIYESIESIAQRGPYIIVR